MTPAIRDITPVSVRVSERTVWTFIRVRCTDGLTGYGEATVHGFETELWNTALLLIRR